jgi:hypothetical protein
MKLIGLALHFVLLLGMVPSAVAEFRSAKDMQKECRVAVDVVGGRAEKTFQSVLFSGECIGYIQGAADGSLTLAEMTSSYKACLPENISTLVLMQNFIAFVDKNPKYTLASTAILMMLAQEYPCAKK